MDNRVKEHSETYVYKVAAASGDGIVVNRHFGKADTFYIYEVKGKGNYKFLETRTVVPICSMGNHDEEKLQNNIDKFKDCKYILVSKIGTGAANKMEQSGITPMELPGMIEESLDKLIIYEQLQNLF